MPDEISQIINNLERSIGKIEGKLDAVVAAVHEMKSSFDSLENGRLSRLEIAFATLQAETTMRAKTVAIWIASGVSIAVSLISALLTRRFL